MGREGTRVAASPAVVSPAALEYKRAEFTRRGVTSWEADSAGCVWWARQIVHFGVELVFPSC